ncbi:MAG: hypothetical protein HKN36_13720 [Hellea sp.]|nr:hypothetical protein [Hellea sp.]
MDQSAKNIHTLHEGIAIPSHDDTGRSKNPLIFGFTGASGGVGVTVSSIQAAYHLSRQTNLLGQPLKTCLLSLDFENSALSQYLDLEPSVSIAEFQIDPAKVDASLCQNWMIKTAAGFDVLILPGTVNGNALVNPNTVLAFLDQMCELYDAIVLDIPRLWSRWTHAALGAADRVGMLAELNVPSLHFARTRSAEILKTVNELSKFEFIINKFERRSFRNSVKLSDAESALREAFLHTISVSQDKLRDALNRGEPLGVSHGEARVTRDINVILDDWTKTELARREHEGLRMATNR